MRNLLPALLAAGLAASAVADEAFPGRWLDGHTTPQNKEDERDYKLYVPTSYQGRPSPLVVMLHGCTQSPDSFAESTRMNGYAESGRFLVLYPAQKMSANPTRCWNWFLPRNQARDSGEPGQVVAMIEQVARQYAVDRKRIYVAGLSAGAAMTAILAACYPDVFAAAAIHDGTMYKAATSLSGAEKVMLTGKAPDPDELGNEAWTCGGKRQLMMPVMVWHGQADKIMNRDNGDHLVRQFSRLNDWADDGQANASALQGPTDQTGQVSGGYAYDLATYSYRGRPWLVYYRVDKLGHAWSGGKDDMLFSDGKGPNASLLMWDFFRQFSR